MIKAKTRAKNGGALYIFGLSEMNVHMLEQGNPIVFDGGEVQLPGHHFVIARADNEKQMEQIATAHSANDPRKLQLFCFTPAMLKQLRTRECVVPLPEAIGPGEILFTFGATEQDIARDMGIDLEERATGYKLVLDPTTGQMVREAVRPS